MTIWRIAPSRSKDLQPLIRQTRRDLVIAVYHNPTVGTGRRPSPPGAHRLHQKRSLTGSLEVLYLGYIGDRKDWLG